MIAFAVAFCFPFETLKTARLHSAVESCRRPNRLFKTSFGRPPAKYVNSPESILYTKSDHLYGLDVVRDAVAKSRQIIIVEGYTDVVLTWQAGIENIAAVLGTALNERHLRLIKRFADQVVLVLDGDEAGQKRANEVLDLFVAADIDLRILTLPSGMDPCDYVLTHDQSKFLNAVAEAPDALDHKIDVETKDVDLVHDTHRASNALNSLIGSIAKAPRVEIRTLTSNPLREQGLIGKLSRRFHTPQEVIRDRLDEMRRANAKRTTRPSVDDAPKRTATFRIEDGETHECELLELILIAPDKIDQIVENISPDQFVLGPVRDAYELICHCYHSGQEVDFNRLMAASEIPAQKTLLVNLMDRGVDKSDATNVNINNWLNDVLAVFHRLIHESQRQQVIDKLESQNLSEEEEMSALAKIIQMKQAEQQTKN